MAWNIALSFLILFFSASCSETKPKVLGGNLIDMGDNDTVIPDSFKFNFAFRNPAATGALARIIYLQGAANTKTSMISACNSAGTNCLCEFMNAGEEIIDETDVSNPNSLEISYDVKGNYFRCKFSDSLPLADLAKVRIRNQNGTIKSEIYMVDTTLTVNKLIGDVLDVNRVREIYRYGCLYNFLQKEGTTSIFFDCSSPPNQCWASGGQSGNFCLLQSTFSYFLFADTYFNNFGQKVADRLYNQGASDRICGLQIKQFDCAGASGTPVRQFGLFADQIGIFDTAIQLSAGPDISQATYGFAAQTSTFLGETVCPPGMERRVFYQATTSNTGLGNSSNYPHQFITRQISSPGTPPLALQVNKVIGGNCNGTECTLPSTQAGNITSFDYLPPTPQTEFCVIPNSLLQN